MLRPPTHPPCSVLLGRREPPSAASVLRDYSQQGEEDSVDPPAPDNDASVASPSSSSLQSFDINSSGNAGPLTVATHLEALSSKIKLSFSPRRHHRQHTDNADPGHAVQSQKPPITSHGVRFDVCSEDEGLRAGVRLSAPLQYRKQGVKFAQEEEGLDLGNEAPLSSCDLATRPKLLQVCALAACGTVGTPTQTASHVGGANKGTPSPLVSPTAGGGSSLFHGPK